MRSHRVLSVLVAAGFVVGSATAAQAVSGSQTVSCDVKITSTLTTLYAGGTMSVTQRSTSENNNRYYWAVSSTGNSVTWKATVDGGTVTWTDVLNSNYTFKTRIVANQNCNGIVPGNGNSSLSWTVTP